MPVIVAARIARVIERELGRSLVGDRPAVALSGGVDSCSILAAFKNQGLHPVVISYTPDTHESTDFQMARQTADNLRLKFLPAVVNMDPDSLELDVRHVIDLGYKSKVEVESLSPMCTIAAVAREHGVDWLLTGDQADGYFCLSKWAAHNYDRSQGVPFRERSRNVKEDTSPERIDAIRERYYREDFSCSAGVAAVCQAEGVQAAFPYRSMKIFNAFKGSVWSEVNRPRIKEPIRLAFDEWFTDDSILVRPTQVNLHKGDSYFGDTLSRLMMERFPGHATPRGLYSSISRGET